MSRGPKSEIEKKNLGEEVIRLRLENKSQQAIATTLGLKQYQVSDYLAKQKFGPENLLKTALTVEITQEIAERHLGQAIGEAEKHLNAVKEGGDDRAIMAAMHSYLQAIDMLLKATGVYERAKKEAEVPPQVETITWVIKVEG